MEDAKPKRTWYRRKRWWAAGLLWLAVVYPFGIGPVNYLSVRGWGPAGLLTAAGKFYDPLYLRISRLPSVGPAYASYSAWWVRRAEGDMGLKRVTPPGGGSILVPVDSPAP